MSMPRHAAVRRHPRTLGQSRHQVIEEVLLAERRHHPPIVMAGEDQRQLDRVLSCVSEVLGHEVVGAYLFGSAVFGGLQRESDLDVLVVTTRHTTREEKQRLAACLLAISGRLTSDGRWRRIELTVVVESEITPWRYPPRLDFQYGDWLRSEFESGNVEPWTTTTPRCHLAGHDGAAGRHARCSAHDQPRSSTDRLIVTSSARWLATSTGCSTRSTRTPATSS